MRETLPDLLGPLLDILDEEVWSAPERLSSDECLNHLGADWRCAVDRTGNKELEE